MNSARNPIAILAALLLPALAAAQGAPPVDNARIGAAAWESEDLVPVPGRKIPGVNVYVPIERGDGTVELRVEAFDGTQPLSKVTVVFDLTLTQFDLHVADLLDQSLDWPAELFGQATRVRKVRVRTGADGRGTKSVNLGPAKNRLDPERPMLLQTRMKARGGRKVGRLYGEAQALPD